MRIGLTQVSPIYWKYNNFRFLHDKISAQGFFHLPLITEGNPAIFRLLKSGELPSGMKKNNHANP